MNAIFEKKTYNTLKKLNNNIFLSFLFGILLTLITQSSSALSAIVIIMVGNNTLSLRSGVATVMGANIGTTFSSILFSFNLGSYSLYILLVGAIILISFKKFKNLGLIICGISLIFYSVDLIENDFLNLLKEDTIKNIIINLNNNNFKSIFAGTIITAIIQSSGAFIAIVQKLTKKSVISVKLGINLMMGSNVGTTFSDLIPALLGSINGKRLALIHIIYNVLGVLLFIPVIPIFLKLFSHIYNKGLIISLAHIVFNVLSSIWGLIFINILIKFSSFIIKGPHYKSEVYAK